MYKIDRRGEGPGGSKNRSLAQTHSLSLDGPSEEAEGVHNI